MQKSVGQTKVMQLAGEFPENLSWERNLSASQFNTEFPSSQAAAVFSHSLCLVFIHQVYSIRNQINAIVLPHHTLMSLLFFRQKICKFL